MQKIILIIVFVFLLSTISYDSFALIVRPSKPGDEIAIIFVPGAGIKAKDYLPVIKSIQNNSNQRVWINILELPLNVAQPIGLKRKIKSAVLEIKKSGFLGDKIYVSGHSMGGAMLQDVVEKDDNYSGLIFFGSYLTRKNRDKFIDFPILTIGAELDGLTRVTRIAEAYYHQIDTAESIKSSKLNQPVVVIKGMNHAQFASGRPPKLVRERDLDAEISEDLAHEKLGVTVGNFLTSQIGGYSSKLVKQVDETGYLLAPLIESMELEGSYHLKLPCSKKKADPRNCWLGSQWVESIQKEFASFDKINYEVENEFHPVWVIRATAPHFHHPKIRNKCEVPDRSCTLKILTISQAIYDKLDKMDTAFAPVSATEIRVKMKSRQSIFKAAGGGIRNFDETDAPGHCARLNRLSIQWALNSASEETLNRYYAKGIQMTISDDLKINSGGPAWIWKSLQYKTAKDDNDVETVQVSSPMMSTSIDHIIPNIRGYYYCKLLSPARALEWIYVDSLRD